MNQLLMPVYTGTFDAGDYLICTAVSLLVGALIAVCVSYRSKCSKSLLLTLVLLPVIVQNVIMLVNGSIGTGLAVMGAFNLVRFRSVPGKAREILGIFFAMAAGLATAMGYVGIAVFFVLVVCAVMTAAEFLPIARNSDRERELKITVPEHVDYLRVFGEVFDTYAVRYQLKQVKTTNLGSLFRLTYTVVLKSEDAEREFLNELRLRNSNLEISFGIPAEDHEEL